MGGTVAVGTVRGRTGCPALSTSQTPQEGHNREPTLMV